MNEYTLNLEQFKNFHDHTELTYQKVEESIKNFDQNHNNKAENKISLPPFIKTFYSIIWRLNKIPTQEEALNIETKKQKGIKYLVI